MSSNEKDTKSTIAKEQKLNEIVSEIENKYVKEMKGMVLEGNGYGYRVSQNGRTTSAYENNMVKAIKAMKELGHFKGKVEAAVNQLEGSDNDEVNNNNNNTM